MYFKIKITTHNSSSLKIVEEKLERKKINFKRVPLPKKLKKFTLNKSSHVNSKAKEHFKLVKHFNLFYVFCTLSELKETLEDFPNDIALKVTATF